MFATESYRSKLKPLRPFTYGRFMQPDPLGHEAGQNLYGYVEGNPVNKTDPSGKAVVEKGLPYRLIGGYATGSNTQVGCQSCVVQTIPGPQWSGGPSNQAAQNFIEAHGGMEGVAAMVAAGRAKNTGDGKSTPFSRDSTDDGDTVTVTGTVNIPNQQKWVQLGGRFVANPNFEPPWYAPLVDYGFAAAATSPIALIGVVEAGIPALVFIGPRGTVFGSSRFGYGAKQGVLNRGYIRFGFTPHRGQAYFRVGIENRHYDIFSMPRP